MQFPWTGLAASRRFVRAMVATGLVLAGIAGCGVKGEFETARVHGKVTHNGQPLATGSLVFVPVSPGPTPRPTWIPAATTSWAPIPPATVPSSASTR